MNSDRPQLVLWVIILVVTGGALGVIGAEFLAGGTGEDGGSIPTASGTPYGGDSGGSSGGGSGTAAPPPFEMQIESVESCGQTCRDVTATLVNNQEREATGVTVYTQIHAGDSTDGDVVWEGTQDVGTLGAGTAETDTQRVDLGYLEAAKVQDSGGQITIRLTVETDQRTVTFVEHRDVS